MADKITKLKDQFLELMEQDIQRQGGVRQINNVKLHGELADIVKDLAEAEYYCTVAKSMQPDDQDYEDRMGYGMGYGMTRQSRGTGTMGHTDPIATIRDILMTADQDTKARIRREFGL